MSNFSNKDQNYNMENFWRKSLIIFGVGLVVVFVFQTMVFFWLSETVQDLDDNQNDSVSLEKVNRQKVTKLMTELENRKEESDELMATSTPLVDPSL